VITEAGKHVRERRSAETPGAESESEFPAESLLWVLSAFCQYFKTPFDPQLVVRELLPPLRSETLLRIAESLGFRARWETMTSKKLAKLRAPFAALLRAAQNDSSLAQETPTSPETGETRPVFAFVVRLEEGRVAFLEQGQPGHKILPLAEFEARFNGAVFRVVPRQQDIEDPDGQTGVASKFGFRWFIPELLKHHRIFRDVLLASLAIQMMALATPLFTLAVIDKVIVHHTFKSFWHFLKRRS
jgi:subfamily B ATP-binding cassette protein HlyB/CyaB